MNRIAIQYITKSITGIVVYGGPINGTGFGNWFCAKYLRLRLLHHPFALWELYVIALFYVIYLLY